MWYATGAAVYAVLGIVYLFRSWDDETDDWYGELRPPGRYFFFAKSVILWPLCLLYRIGRMIFGQRKPEAEDE